MKGSGGMANQIPLMEGTNAAGGVLVFDTHGSTFQNTILRESAVLSLARVDRVGGLRQKYAVYAGRPVASFVAEGGAKQATGAEFAEISVNVKKIVSLVMLTEEIVEDATENVEALVGPDVEGAIADTIDAHALGYAAGGAITTSFDSSLAATTQTVELGAGGDAFATAVSAALTMIESNGGRPSGIVAASDVRGLLRDARTSSDTTKPVFTDGFGREPDSIYGQQINYSSNLDALPAGAGKLAAIVGDFSHAVFALRRDLTVRRSTEATIDVAGTLHHLWQQNKQAILYETRIGFTTHDVNRMFVRITNAT